MEWFATGVKGFEFVVDDPWNPRAGRVWEDSKHG
jgi:hypothetical protein